MKKEFLGESLYFRTTTSYDYEIYSTDLTNWRETDIKNLVYSEFSDRYSGDIFVQAFEVPTEWNSLNDSNRIQKFKVNIDVKATCSGINDTQPELGTPYYTGVDAKFWNQWGVSLLDFREDFIFEQVENGNNSYSHDLSFQLITGTKLAALTVASGIFSLDKSTTFGITAFPGGVTLGDSTNYLDYYSEVYDQIRQTYHFNKRREILPISGTQVVNDYNHTLDFSEDGLCNVSEKATIKGKLTFTQAKSNLDTFLAGAYGRCNSFYGTYSPLVGATNSLVNIPTKTVKTFNEASLSTAYDISFTNNPQFKTNGVSVEENFEIEGDEYNFVNIKHHLNFNANKRLATPTVFYDLIASATGTSPTSVTNYYAQLGALYSASKPMKQIKLDTSWPKYSNKASVSFEYSNNIKNFVTINGIFFNYIDFKVSNTKPVDITNEYKIINRPTKQSVINYAYQTEKGQITVSLEGGLGRNANEFISGFRSNYSTQITALYKYGIGIFLSQFYNMIPSAFTYYLSDVKYMMNQDGVLSMTLVFTYTLKKYMK